MKIKSIVAVFICISWISGCRNQGSNGNSSDNSGNKNDSVSLAAEKFAAGFKYISYCNARYSFCVDYPEGFLQAQGESTSKDGQVFKSADGSFILMIYRDFRDNMGPFLKFRLDTAFSDDSHFNNPAHSKKEIVFKKLGKNYYQLISFEGEKALYQKSVLKKDGFITCTIEIKLDKRQTYKSLIDHIFNSLR